jgi:hypothetical protein
MMTRNSDSREEPFIGSLRERIQQTKAENARARASMPTPPRHEGPPSEESLRAARKSRALADIARGRRRMRGLWILLVLLAAVAVAGALAIRYGMIKAPTTF